jgi:predicted enzyme related to lactoylglutathione lyase
MAQAFISHAEIPTTNLDATKDFLTKVFGWDFRPFGNGYLLYNTHKGVTIGLRKSDSINKGNTTIFHIHVDNIEETLKKAEAAGGKIERAKTTIPVMGWYALINDPDGNTIGLFETH